MADRLQERIEDQGGPLTEDDRSAIQRGADVMFLVQVPLKHKNMGYLNGMGGGYGYGAGAGISSFGYDGLADAKPAMKSAAPAPTAQLGQSGARGVGELAPQPDVEQPGLRHGPNLGPSP